MNEPRLLLDNDSICYGCRYYRNKQEIINDHCEDDYDNNYGCCDVHCLCHEGSMNI